MLSQIAVYLQTQPIRRLALVTYTPGDSSYDQPLIITYVRGPTPEVNLELVKELDLSQWKLINHFYGYLGNLNLSEGDIVACFVGQCQPVASLVHVDLKVGGLEAGETASSRQAYHITRVNFISLCHGRYDRDPDNLPAHVHEEEEFDDNESYGSDTEPVAFGYDQQRRISKGKHGRSSSYHPMIRSSSANAASTEGNYSRPTPVDVEKFPYDAIKNWFSSQFFYFCHSYDLSQSLQARYRSEQLSDPLPTPSHDFDIEFVYNHHMLYSQLQFLQSQSNDPKRKEHLIRTGLITPIIQGCVTEVVPGMDGGLGGNKVRSVIISRVGWKRAGTRFNTRGLDDEGHVANFVETELIMQYRTKLFSYVTIRGSVPAFWNQDGNQLLGHKIQMARGIEATQPASTLHFKRLESKYGGTYVINLLSQAETSPESQLSYRFTELCAMYPGKKAIGFTSFDFHAACKNNQYANADLLIDQLAGKLGDFGYFLYDMREGRLELAQSSVVRVNCLDCLDRTNVIQGLILNHLIKQFLYHIQYQSPTPLLRNLAEAVATNGDHISKIYSGTGALQSGVAVGGKANILNKLTDASKSVSRMYLHHFHDKDKLGTIELVLGRDGKVPVGLSGYAPATPARSGSENGKIEKEDSGEGKRDDIRIHCGTYNVNGRYPSGSPLTPWLLPPNDEPLPDIYALTFEEIVELTPTQILSADLERTNQWQQLLTRDLDRLSVERGHKPSYYSLLTSEQLVGICLFVFIKRDLLPSVRQVANANKKTGLRGMAGNKGAASIRFKVKGISMCFVACHFASGQMKFEDRNRDFHTIHHGLQFVNYGGIDKHEAVFYIGDFNYRINLPHHHVTSILSHPKPKLAELLERDQLIHAMKNDMSFKGFIEAPITFEPTYKFDVGTDTYDTSEKQRIPAWTDRILYKGDKVGQVYYTTAQLYESDHRPVVAGYTLNPNATKRVNLNRAHTTGRYHHNRSVTEGMLLDLNTPTLPPKPRTAETLNLPPPSSDSFKWWDLPLTSALPKPGQSPVISSQQEINEQTSLATLDQKFQNLVNFINPFKQEGLEKIRQGLIQYQTTYGVGSVDKPILPPRNQVRNDLLD